MWKPAPTISNSYFWKKRIQQGAGHVRLSTPNTDAVFFDDDIGYININYMGHRFATDTGSLEEQVVELERGIESYRKFTKIMKETLRECEKLSMSRRSNK
jgi:hypothetical protein